MLATGDPRAEDGYAFIVAAHRLVTSGSDATKADLVLGAASHALRSGDKTSAEVLEIVNQIWPGAKLKIEAVEQALESIVSFVVPLLTPKE